MRSLFNPAGYKIRLAKMLVLAACACLSFPAIAQDNIMVPLPGDAAQTAPDPALLAAPPADAPPAAAEEQDPGMDELLKKIGDAASEVKEPTLAPQAPAVPTEIVTEVPEAQQAPPEQQDLVSPVVPTPESAAAANAGADINVPEIPALPAGQEPDPNLFFDADALVPAGEMGTKGGPRKVNPALEPASKLVIVKKDYSPGSRQAQLVSAERAVMLGRYDSAFALYDGLYQKNKKDPSALMGRAVALQYMGQDDAAMQAYEEFVKLRPNDTKAEVNMLGLLGKRYPAVAERRLLELHEKNPENVTILAQVAVVEAELGHYADAVRYLGMAAAMEPQNASHLFNMAVISDRAGNTKDALKYYEQALEIDTIYGGGHSIPRDSVYERLAQLR